MDRAAAVLGLAETAPGAEVAAAASQLPGGVVVEARERLASASGLIARASEVAPTFAALAQCAGCGLMDRLAVLGHLAGCWGRPYRWVPGTRRLLELGRAFWQQSPGGRAEAVRGSSDAGGTHDFVDRKPP